ncbi:MAG: hypothetical protein ACLSA2_06235 [Candidatus Gastranaerophilaceae bacterium]
MYEKVHASDEMKDFAENYDKLTSSEKSLLDAYWNSNPQIKEHRSIAMKDTIKLFMDLYGVDGNNEEFRELINYAHEIKPARLERQRLHDIKQAEYDEMFAQLAKEQEETKIMPSEDKVKPVPLSEDKSLRTYTVFPETHEIRYNGDLDEYLRGVLKEELSLLPEPFVKKYTQYLINHPLVTDKYKLTLAVDGSVPEGYEDKILPDEELHRFIQLIKIFFEIFQVITAKSISGRVNIYNKT